MPPGRDTLPRACRKALTMARNGAPPRSPLQTSRSDSASCHGDDDPVVCRPRLLFPAPSGASQLFTFAIHYSLNGQIDVQGDTARAQWYLFMPCTLGEGNRAMWRAGVDHEEYVRVAGEWKFKRKTSAPLFHTPFEEGWAKTRFG